MSKITNKYIVIIDDTYIMYSENNDHYLEPMIFNSDIILQQTLRLKKEVSVDKISKIKFPSQDTTLYLININFSDIDQTSIQSPAYFKGLIKIETLKIFMEQVMLCLLQDPSEFLAIKDFLLNKYPDLDIDNRITDIIKKVKKNFNNLSKQFKEDEEVSLFIETVIRLDTENRMFKSNFSEDCLQKLERA